MANTLPDEQFPQAGLTILRYQNTPVTSPQERITMHASIGTKIHTLDGLLTHESRTMRIFKHAKNHSPAFSWVSFLAADSPHGYMSSASPLLGTVNVHQELLSTRSVLKGYMVFLYLVLGTNGSKH